MKSINISEARNTLPTLVESVASTRKPIVLLRYGKPAAMLMPIQAERAPTNPYPLRGTPITVSDDFDAPLAHLWGAYEVAEAEATYGSAKERFPITKRKGKKT